MSIITNGTIHSYGGQFGLTVIDTLTTSPIDLWVAYPERPHNFVLDPNGVDRTVRLPLVGVDADVGHSVFIKNDGTTNTLTVADAGGATIQVLGPKESNYIIGRDVPNDWTIVMSGNEVPTVTTFISLSDTPASYAANRILATNGTPDAVIFTENINGTTTDPSQNSITFGTSASTGTRSLAIGATATATDNAVAVGPDAVARIPHTRNETGGPTLRKATGTTITGQGAVPNVVDDLNFDKFRLFSGTGAAIATEVIDFTATTPTEYRIRIPIGVEFFLDSINIIQVSPGTGVGSNGSLTFGDAAGAFMGLTGLGYPDNRAANFRTRYSYLTDYDHIDTYMSITVTGLTNGGTFRCIWRGLILETE